MKRGKQRTKRRGKAPRADTRRHPRAEREWDVILEAPGTPAKKGTLTGLSPFGAKLRLRAKRSSLPPGATLELRLSPSPGEPPLALKGLVWRTDADGQAIVFINLSTDEFLRLKALVKAPASSPA